MDSILRLRSGFAVTVVRSVGNTSPFIVGALCKGFNRSRCRRAWVQAHGRGCCGSWSRRLSILTIGCQCRTLACTLHTRKHVQQNTIYHTSVYQAEKTRLKSAGDSWVSLGIRGSLGAWNAILGDTISPEYISGDVHVLSSWPNTFYLSGQILCCVCMCVYIYIRTQAHTHALSLTLPLFLPALSRKRTHTNTHPTPSPTPTSTHARMNQSINMRTCPMIGSSCTEIGSSVPTICLSNVPPKVSSVWDIAASFWGSIATMSGKDLGHSSDILYHVARQVTYK